jgi:hypothetical protein
MARKMTVTLEHETEKGWEIVSEDTSSPAALASAKQLAREGVKVRLTIEPYVKPEPAQDEGEPEGEGESDDAAVASEQELEQPAATTKRRSRK